MGHGVGEGYGSEDIGGRRSGPARAAGAARASGEALRVRLGWRRWPRLRRIARRSHNPPRPLDAGLLSNARLRITDHASRNRSSPRRIGARRPSARAWPRPGSRAQAGVAILPRYHSRGPGALFPRLPVHGAARGCRRLPGEAARPAQNLPAMIERAVSGLPAYCGRPGGQSSPRPAALTLPRCLPANPRLPPLALPC